MAMPKYNELYIPILKCLQDGEQHSNNEVKMFIIGDQKLTGQEVTQLLPCGNQTVLDNRFGWARTYLRKAGLIVALKRGWLSLTEEGKVLVAKGDLEKIDNQYLTRYKGFQDFLNRGSEEVKHPNTIEKDSETPQDTLDLAYEKINENLADNLMNEIMKQDADFFEKLVLQLMAKIGYGGSLIDSGIRVGKNGDEGIDGIIKEDALGFSEIYIQAKRWDVNHTVGRPEIQKFVGALAGQGGTKGLFITTAQFTKEAVAYASKQHTMKIVLVDGKLLTRLMIEHDLGVSVVNIYSVKRVDTDFFTDEL